MDKVRTNDYCVWEMLSIKSVGIVCMVKRCLPLAEKLFPIGSIICFVGHQVWFS